MNLRVIILLVFTPIWIMAGPLDPKEKVVKIDYSFYRNNTNSSEIDVKGDQALLNQALEAFSQNENNFLMTVYANKNYLRVEENGFLKRVYISNYIENTAYIIDSLAQNAYPSYPVKSHSINTLEETDTNNEHLKIAFFADTKIIAGRTCKRASITFDNTETIGINIWYDETLPSIVWGQYSYLDRIPGAALEITSNFEQEMGIQAKIISEIQVPLSIFKIPLNYQILEYNEDEFLDEQEVIDVQNDPAFAFSNGYHWYQDQKLGLFGIRDTLDKIIIEPSFFQIESFSDGIAIVSYKQQQGAINDKGQLIIPYIYDELHTSNEGMIPFMELHKWGFFNVLGTKVIPATYNYVGDFSEGLALVSNGEKFGYINNTGKVVIPLQFDYASSFEDGEAQVEIDYKNFSINKRGIRIRD
ncbi:WG repeat-containing protein [Flavobacterium sp. NKUCC04_CG]|uniref:WG repeat-containing protein n=1 Tax=Flavobacterium sp. NKUCC04_CG TaxID=2842121 RepID=UPI001C5B294B|nr:WG repeat-containing protein [Flavobacterium sp. NKUCC04_CG]MBW3519046.1 WG repeat-containing protein [Flavobacterium sp. NKUCC04_CG]